MSKTANITEFLNSRKVELSSEQVNLALRDDIIAGFQKYLGQRDVAMKAANKAENAIIEAYNQYAAIAAFANGTLKDIDQIKAKAKELGLELDPDMKGIETKLKTEVKGAVKSATDVRSLASAMSAIKTAK